MPSRAKGKGKGTSTFSLSRRELNYLKSHELGRLATSSGEGMPHVVPIIYALDGSSPVIAVDYGTKKLKNLRENQSAALLVDEYDPNSGILLQGRAEVLERGKEYLRLLKILFDRFEYYRNNPWKEGESPIVKLVPEHCASWGIPKG